MLLFSFSLYMYIPKSHDISFTSGFSSFKRYINPIHFIDIANSPLPESREDKLPIDLPQNLPPPSPTIYFFHGNQINPSNHVQDNVFFMAIKLILFNHGQDNVSHHPGHICPKFSVLIHVYLPYDEMDITQRR